jgi:glutamate carboxypeptidase
MEVANQITKKLHGEAGEIITENGRPVFWFGAKNPKIVLLCHLDTVWPHGSFQPLWSVVGDVVRGPGAYDMKAGFLQALYAMKDLSRDKIAIIATSDEETGSATSRGLIERVAKDAEAVLVFESAIDGKVKTGRKGTSMYKIIVHGRAAHAGLEPEKGINATVEIAEVVRKVVALQDLNSGTTVVPTAMASGTTTNTFKMAELERVDAAIRKLTPTNPECRIEIQGGINRPPLELSATTALYERLEKVAAANGFAPVGSAQVGGASDGNFAAAAGAPTLDGLGALGSGAHALTEWVQISAMTERSQLIHEFIKDLIK